MRKFRIARMTHIIIAVCILILAAYFGKNMFSMKLSAVQLGKIAINTFCPASLYDKHLYYLDEDKRAAAMLFGNVFPLVRFLGMEGESLPKEERQEIDVLIGAGRDAGVVVSAPAEEPQEAETEESTDGADSMAQEGESTTQSGNTEEESESTETENGPAQPPLEENESRHDSEASQMPSSSLVSSSVHALSYAQLTDFNYVHNNFYVIPSHTALSEELLRPEEFLETDLSVAKDRPCILLYHTHSQEAFKDSAGKDMTIVQAGDYLEKILKEQYGYEVIHITTQFDMKDGTLDRGKAYTYAEKEIGQALAEHPEVDMVIDLHRDGVNENLHFVTEINGKPTAKVMLFNGISYSNAQGNIEYLYNPYLKDNLALTYQLYALGKTYYPDFFRCIYIEAYRYNLHLCRRSMLIEAGAQTNTFEEVLNAMEPLAELIVRELGGERMY